ncbi:MAG: hypothetical protein SFH39_17800 [Candidatus Magnetobacterium sp. LHC-1]|uniref:Secreted protein n=1 Tax=Candidatus Magnetobacterium casense TaxID=1455061 RepID=A0ABS6RUL0_9BACT|nr:hypothetical protein [Candidatus Magnetobacterium casensis]MBF0606485.1 hypothetical protein [Nitrospirota bacterium]MBV6340311.1 hypothetical protein [Candidatus Magnetobacterium casensis]
MKKYHVLVAVLMVILVTVTQVYAMGMGGGTGMGSSDNFGMMNGMSASPVVGGDGTAYLVTYKTGATSGMGTGTFESTLTAITSAGQKTSITLTGYVSRPVVSPDGGLLVAATSMPDMSQYNMMGYYNTSGNSKSTVYAVPLPLTQDSKPLAISLDGNFASVPVFASGKIYVTTTDFGGSMMGGGSYTNPQQGKSYLYIINLDGTIASKVEI